MHCTAETGATHRVEKLWADAHRGRWIRERSRGAADEQHISSEPRLPQTNSAWPDDPLPVAIPAMRRGRCPRQESIRFGRKSVAYLRARHRLSRRLLSFVSFLLGSLVICRWWRASMKVVMRTRRFRGRCTLISSVLCKVNCQYANLAVGNRILTLAGVGKMRACR